MPREKDEIGDDDIAVWSSPEASWQRPTQRILLRFFPPHLLIDVFFVGIVGDAPRPRASRCVHLGTGDALKGAMSTCQHSSSVVRVRAPLVPNLTENDVKTLYFLSVVRRPSAEPSRQDEGLGAQG